MVEIPYKKLVFKLLGKISLFESQDEADEFLRQALAVILNKSGASRGEAYLYNEKSGRMEFRVGFNEGDLWDRCRLDSRDENHPFQLHREEPQGALTGNSIIVSSIEEDSTEFPYRKKAVLPISRGPEKLGIFVMYHREERGFGRLDSGDLKEALALFGDMLAEASLLLEGKGNRTPGNLLPVPQIIKGQGISRGIVEGEALPVWNDLERVVKNLPSRGTVVEERELFADTLRLSGEQLQRLTDSISSDDEDLVSLIFTAQQLMLKDVSLTGKIEALIDEGKSAAQSVVEVITEYARIFSSLTEVRLAEKAQDVRDLGFRLLTNMSGAGDRDFSYQGKIIISRHIYPSDLYRLSVEGAAGAVLQGAAPTAHISILAKSLNLPVLITDDKSLLTLEEGTPLVLDVERGKLYIDPEDVTRRAILHESRKGDIGTYTLHGQTADGVLVNVMANVNILRDAKEAVAQGAEGIGLYRSEFPFIIKNDFLSEEQQYRIYRSIVKSQPKRPVTLRTADIGGDKLMQGREGEEANPFLGVRGIRFSLANREIFREQLRAMLRAGEGADLRIMLPMVSDAEEIVRARKEIDDCIGELKARGVPHNDSPKVGAMVELPSAAMSVTDLAEVTDFLSIGTNDLTMYLLAVDRTNENLSHLYRSHHPTVLRVLAFIASQAKRSDTELSVCGDIATDPMMIPFLVGLGIRKLSVPPSSVETVKQIVMKKTLSESRDISKRMLKIRSLREMEEYREGFIQS
ncbi:MAG: phosphoenolpyruvate--protein phosphotransferase [Spirochaetales bacterium]|nr:phosphoenolpyruvate--protein phosphotransferase [Spirochaetales bacterium]